MGSMLPYIAAPWIRHGNDLDHNSWDSQSQWPRTACSAVLYRYPPRPWWWYEFPLITMRLRAPISFISGNSTAWICCSNFQKMSAYSWPSDISAVSVHWKFREWSMSMQKPAIVCKNHTFDGIPFRSHLVQWFSHQNLHYPTSIPVH